MLLDSNPANTNEEIINKANQYFYNMIYGSGENNNLEKYESDNSKLQDKISQYNLEFVKEPSLTVKKCKYAYGKLLWGNSESDTNSTKPIYVKLNTNNFGLYSDDQYQNNLKMFTLSNVEQIFIYYFSNLFCFEISIKKHLKKENDILCTKIEYERNEWLNLFSDFKLCDKDKIESFDVANQIYNSMDR